MHVEKTPGQIYGKLYCKSLGDISLIIDLWASVIFFHNINKQCEIFTENFAVDHRLNNDNAVDGLWDILRLA